ncbi:MAG: methyltransferase domain-containing protein [Candidatus Lokiarchaeota archaeon]|nr:methyltransferase domain-containing protein [Candidatus Lokiarchaeota archaeon]
MSKIKRNKDFNYLIRIFQNFVISWYIYMGIKLGIFDFITDKRYRVETIAKKLNLRKQILADWCNSMIAEGLMIKKNDEYELTEWSRKYLCKDSKIYIGFIISAVEYFSNAFSHFENNFKKDKKFFECNSRQMLKIVRNIAPIADIVSYVILKELDIVNEPFKILDVGCGLGNYLLNLAEEIPKIEGLGIDIEPIIIEEARKLANKKGLSDKIKFKEGNALDLNLNEEFDLIILSNIIQAFNFKQNKKLFGNLNYLLKKKGKIIMIDCLLDKDKRDAKFNILFNLYLKFESLSARLYTLDEIKKIANSNSLQVSKYNHLLLGIDLIIIEKINEIS